MYLLGQNCTVEIVITEKVENYHWNVQPWSGDQHGQWPLVSCDSDMCHSHTPEQQENWSVGPRDQTESHISLKNINHLPEQILNGLSDEQLQSLGEVNLYPWSTPWDSQGPTPILFCAVTFSRVAQVLVHSTVKKILEAT